MRGDDESDVFRFGTQFNAYINAPTRALLRSRSVQDATVLCRVIVGAVGQDAAFTGATGAVYVVGGPSCRRTKP